MTESPTWFPESVPLSAAARGRFALSPGAGAEALEAAARLVREGGGPATSGARLRCAAALLNLQRHLAATWLAETALGPTLVRVAGPTMARFRSKFPPAGNRPCPNEVALVELLLTRLANENAALRMERPLFDDGEVEAAGCMARLEGALREAPGVQGLGDDLLSALRSPARAHPDDLEAQLAFALDRWAELLPEGLRLSALRATDALREAHVFRGAGPGPVPEIRFDQPASLDDDEYEGFTRDQNWMANVVLIAKQTHVWLHQLSERFDRPIRHLDEIPDEALAELAHSGFDTLWLIGLWERSHASREIKRRMGNTEALASAYALWDYVIAEDLGGEAALEGLRHKAEAQGMRLAADMVPNHVGIDGRWVMEHPEWFVQAPEAPYPGYTFDGPNLSAHEGVEVHLEEGYWDRSDAAVVFRRRDRATGEERFIYHGNDGTQMPWNDTAQLDFLNAEVREAVMAQILEVARRFPVIRLDAAMVLARRHIRRLWHPPPGEGGAVPSRSGFALSAEDFARAMPKEFWREVVDRIKAERPDTLLLAEAFWMLEGYFVRTLGMHRVYNSAFMNMLKAEENAKFRASLRNVLEFSPEVLKRFVNFLNNPDEDTAVAQFGKGDKYFGVTIMMSTLPGLPMFGHGQVEGLTEKYGMEYAKAYQDEAPDEGLVRWHEHAVFPLLRRRWLFSEVEHFALFDFERHGGVDESVFAWCNRVGEHRALIFYNNAQAETAGYARTSVGMLREDTLVRLSLGEALGLDRHALYSFREHISGQSYLRSGAELCDNGLFVHLRGYQAQVFWEWQERDASWQPVADALDGGGCADLDAARQELERGPLYALFGAAVDSLLTGAPALRPLAAALDVELVADDASDPWLRLARSFGAEVLAEPGFDRVLAERLAKPETVLLVQILAAGEPWPALLRSEATQAWLAVNEHEGVRWFNRERMLGLLDALGRAGVVVPSLTVIEASEYRLDALLGEASEV